MGRHRELALLCRSSIIARHTVMDSGSNVVDPQSYTRIVSVLGEEFGLEVKYIMLANFATRGMLMFMPVFRSASARPTAQQSHTCCSASMSNTNTTRPKEFEAGDRCYPLRHATTSGTYASFRCLAGHINAHGKRGRNDANNSPGISARWSATGSRSLWLV